MNHLPDPTYVEQVLAALNRYPFGALVIVAIVCAAAWAYKKK